MYNPEDCTTMEVCLQKADENNLFPRNNEIKDRLNLWILGLQKWKIMLKI